MTGNLEKSAWILSIGIVFGSDYTVHLDGHKYLKTLKQLGYCRRTVAKSFLIFISFRTSRPDIRNTYGSSA